MEDENEYKKLPTEEKCQHKLWKARVAGYEEAAKLFNQIDDEKSPDWNKYLNLIKKFVSDSNAVAQEKGLEAAVVFVENCFNAGKTTGDVMSGIVAKCIAAPKTKTKDLALQLTLMYVEIEKHEVVQEELTKGMEHKNPKIVSACVSALTTALKQFGNKVIAIKPLVKKIPALLTDRDKGVRDEGKALVVEMHRWIGSAMDPHIAPLQAVVQQELRDAFAANSGSAVPTRYLRSQQSKMAEVAVARQDADGGEEEECDGGDNDAPEVDPLELVDPVEILSRLPKDFYEKLEAKKWQERKEALDAAENLLKAAPKLEGGDYADLVRAIKKVISKDSNVMLVALAGRELGMLAAGLRNKFQPYAVACVSAILEKFKEKKTNVVAALRDAIDAIYPCTNLEAILEDVTEAFNNKNPSVKSETALFLARAFCRTQPAALNKKMLKAYVGGLLKLLESADPSVRDAAADALGTATKLVGEKNIAPHIGKLDNLKEAKIKEFQDKAVIQVKIAGPKKEAKPKQAAGAKGDGKAGSAQPKAVKRPGTAVVKKASGIAKAAPSKAVNRESELSQDEVDQIAEEVFTAELVTGLQDGDWKARLAAVRSFQQTVCGLGPTDVSSQVLLRTLNKKPGLRDTNMQVLRARIHALKYIAENFPLSSTSVDFVLSDIVTRLGEATVMLSAQDVLSTFAEAETCGLEHVVRESLSYAMDGQKNPKVQVELFNWLSNAIQEFGMNMDIKPLMAHTKKAVAATNPNVRTSAINFLGVLSMYTGPSVLSHFDSEKPALRLLIQAEMDKYANNTRPEPVRGINKSSSKSSVYDDVVEQNGSPMEAEDDEPAPAPVADTATRTDMALLITEPLLAEINDKNWKVRAEAMEKLNNMISSSAPIKTSLGELPPALIARLLDSNLKLAQTAQQICESLAVAMGIKCKSHVRTFFPAFFQALGDSKQWIRTGAVACLDTWCAQAGGAHVAFDGEMVLDALKGGSPTLRAELYQWLADNLPNLAPKSFPREELVLCVPILYACIEDRNADVRKKAGDCVLPFMLHLGYEAMHKHLDKLKPGSKSTVQAALDKARPSLPVAPLPTKGKKEDPKGVKTGGAQRKDADKKSAEKKGAAPPGKAKGIVKSASGSRTKKDEEDFAPLLPNNNAKNQRIVDDQKLKVLKWNFVTPREEFFDLLKDQMLGTGFHKQLVQNMFHNDFRYHLKALESLADDLQDNGPSLQANLDLVLKWLTLRFFDTNPSVILKGLEYLSSVFNYLIDSDYTMAEYEANCFIPYLVLKVGDPKDSVRNGVKALFKQICVVYSVTKLFGYLMEGLKSKNARQRSECLECIGHLLETYGSGVMSPSLGVALKELARHIGDRDNGVRSAALNCIAHAYFLEGEKIYKMIGQVSDKELSLLEERIKRAAKTRSAENRKSTLLPLSASGKPLARQSSDCEPEEDEPPTTQITVEAMTPNGNEEEEEEQEVRAPATVTLAPVAAPVVSGPFGLDPVVLARLEAQKPRTERAELRPRPDTSFLDDPVPIPNFRPMYTHPAHGNINSNNVMSPPHRLTTPQTFSAPPPGQATLDDTLLVDVIHSISSPNLKTASRGLKMINNALSSGRGSALRTYEERLVQAVTQQIRQLRTGAHASDEAADTYRGLAAVLAGFYEIGGLGASVSAGGVGALLAELLRVLSAAELPGGVGTLLEKRDADKLVRVLNVVCVRVLEHSQHTALLCALVSLLHETIGQQYPAFPRYPELLLKCFWKTLKIFPSWESASIDYDTVLYKIHIFYKTYPASYWKKNSEVSDTSYRTVKTFVHTLVKMKGTSITNHLTQIPDAHNTDLYAYLQKVFQQLKLEDKSSSEGGGGGGGGGTTHPGGGETVSMSPHHGSRLPRDVHEELIHILKSIANKEQNQDALSKLLDIRERHPEVDIWSYMQGSSFYFRSYVERGLTEAADRRRLGHTHAATAGLAHTITSIGRDNNNENENDDEDDEDLHLVYMERLRKLQAQAGMPLSQPNFVARTPGSDPKSLADAAPTLNIDPQFELCAASQGTHYSGEGQVDVEKLRLKLQQIKNASRR